MDAKLAWWEKLAKAGAKDKGETVSSANAPSDEVDNATRAAVRPGAIAVRGPEYRGSGFDETSTVPDGGEGGADRGVGSDNGDNDETPLHVDSYLVREGLTDEEIRQRILAGTAHAEAVDKVEPSETSPRRSFRNAAAALLVVFVVAAAIAVGVAVPMSNQQPSGPSAPQYDESVVALVKYIEFQGSGGLAGGVFAETKDSAGYQLTSGLAEFIICKPKACTESDTSCLVGVGDYVPGCCAGADCPNETKCHEQCPPPPDSCYLTDPTNHTCLQSDCYTCLQEDGEDLYVLKDFAFSIDCLEVGTAIRPDNGLEYKWAIFCGPVIVGPIVEENKDLGEYMCGAVRRGANLSDEDGGILAFILPCQFIALAECGCAPSDMYTFGLPEPTGPCQPNEGCSFLCEGVGGGNEYARNLCRSFPGNMSWWDGENAFNVSWFVESKMATKYQLDIYIKGVD